MLAIIVESSIYNVVKDDNIETNAVEVNNFSIALTSSKAL